MDATFTLEFARGTVTAPMALREILPTESLTIQRGKGPSRGQGEFAGARGRVEGGGILPFTESGVDRARLRGAAQVMKTFLVELRLPSAGAASLAVAGERARAAVRTCPRARHGPVDPLRLRRRGRRVFLVFEAPSPEAVGEASRRAALEYERIVEGGEPG